MENFWKIGQVGNFSPSCKIPASAEGFDYRLSRIWAEAANLFFGANELLGSS
jgi:hypothetical protein